MEARGRVRCDGGRATCVMQSATELRIATVRTRSPLHTLCSPLSLLLLVLTSFLSTNCCCLGRALNENVSN